MSTPHDTPADSRERSYDRLRKEGFDRDTSRKIADEAARRIHDTNRDRRDR